MKIKRRGRSESSVKSVSNKSDIVINEQVVEKARARLEEIKFQLGAYILGS